MENDKNKRLVGQRNDFIQKTVYKELNINDLKVFKSIISKINYNDTLFNDFYTIDYGDLDLAGIDSPSRFKIVDAALVKLSGTFVSIKDKDDNTVKLGLISNKFIYKKNSSKIIVEIHDDLQPYLLDLKQKYTRYSLENIKSFDNIHTLQIYELLRSFVATGDLYYTLKQLREYLNIKPEQYKLYGNFKNRILTPAIDTINLNTDIIVEVKELKLGRSIEKFHFIIESKENLEPEDFNLIKLIDKVFRDKQNNKFLIMSFENDKENNNYRFKVFNIKNQEITFTHWDDQKTLFAKIKDMVKKSEYKNKVNSLE
jgi:hypothetical protein